jgi:hypothetical protein
MKEHKTDCICTQCEEKQRERLHEKSKLEPMSADEFLNISNRVQNSGKAEGFFIFQSKTP